MNRIKSSGGDEMINKKSPIPVYYQLEEDIKRKIEQGVWQVGQCISSERELAEEYGVSRMTIRQSLGELVQDGILVREKGKGTFVCKPKVKQRDMMSFSEVIAKSGRTLKTKIIEFQVIDRPLEYDNIFKFKKLYKINRLRIVDEEIVANEIVYIPCEYCGVVTENMLEGSLFKMLKSLGFDIKSSDASIAAVNMNEKYRKIFKVNNDVPLLRTKSKFFTSDDTVIYVEDSVYRSDKYVLEVNIAKRDAKIK